MRLSKSADFWFRVGTSCYFILRNCGWHTAKSPDYCCDFSNLALLFRWSLSFGLLPLRLQKALSFRSSSGFFLRFRFLPIAEGRALYDSVVAAPDSTMAPMIRFASFDADVLMVSLVVFPLDVAEGIFLATFDPYVPTIRYFSRHS